MALTPVIIGVGLATYGDYYATILGFNITLAGALLAALKTVATNHLQTAGVRLPAMELLYRMSPAAFLQSLVIATMTGELQSASSAAYGGMQGFAAPAKVLLVLFLNGGIAFGLNVVSFSANKQVGALTMTVAANVKQILAIVLAVVFWKLEVGWMNAFGQSNSIYLGSLRTSSVCHVLVVLTWS